MRGFSPLRTPPFNHCLSVVTPANKESVYMYSCACVRVYVCVCLCVFATVSVGESTTVSFMFELLKLRDNYLYFSGGFHLYQVDIATLIDYVATSTV